jgi:hypothetical protein
VVQAPARASDQGNFIGVFHNLYGNSAEGGFSGPNPLLGRPRLPSEELMEVRNKA